MDTTTLMKMTSRLTWSGRSLLLALALLTALAGCIVPFQSLEESLGLRFWYKLRGLQPAPEQFVIIALNSEASKALGLPNRPDQWPRRLHAELINGLKAQGARAVVFDLLFDRVRNPDDDRLLAQALAKAGNVLLAEYVLREQAVLDPGVRLSTEQRLAPHPDLAQAAHATAPFPLPKTPHGVVEFWSFAPGIGDEPTLPLRIAALAQPGRYRELLSQAGINSENPVPDAAQLRQLRSRFPLTHAFNLYGPAGHIRTIPYHKALALLAQPNDRSFHDKIVLVGFSEFNQPEQRDVYATAYSQENGLDISGVELMATASANLLAQEWLHRPGLLGHFFILLGMALLLIAPWHYCSVRTSLVISLLLAVVYVIAGRWAFGQIQLWLPAVMTLAIQWPLLVGASLWAKYRHSEHQRQAIQRTLHRYLPGQAIEQLVKNKKTSQGEFYAVCLCCDIEDYSSIAESQSPEALRAWLNQHFEQVISLVRQQHGHVVDITGDAVLALWISGRSPEHECAQALNAAVALQKLPVRTRIGLHYGPVAFGEVGAEAHMELRAVGDIVNTTSRLQGANKSLSTRVLLSQQVADYLSDQSNIKRLGWLQLVGKQQPIETYTLNVEDCLGWEGIKTIKQK
jgi:adenylate cyclase